MIGRDHPMVEIGAVLNGTQEGRRGHMDITFYRSLGIAAQDLAAAHAILALAEARGVGVVVDMA
jgi:ornithine cyclodeaminase